MKNREAVPSPSFATAKREAKEIPGISTATTNRLRAVFVLCGEMERGTCGLWPRYRAGLSAVAEAMTIGLVCSAFDLLHAGHMLMLEDAKRHCDYLIAGLQKDPSVTAASYRGKKKDAPVLTLGERRILLRGTRYVDKVFVYADEPDLLAAIKELGPHVRILGSDWRGKHATGQELAARVYYHERRHGYSTTSIKRRVLAQAGHGKA